ncbi:HD domain-containing phosphohydrolase [Catellatospora coxensis]
MLAAAHERHDGGGHPHGLAGSAIPIGARILTLCEGWADARHAVPSPARARLVLLEGRGSRYDPAVLDVFLGLADEGALTDPR